MRQKQITRLIFDTLAEMNASTSFSGEIAFCFETDSFYKADGVGGYVKTAGDAYFQFSQATPATVWVIAHNLGKNPSVRVFDTANSEVIGDIVYNDSNNLTVTFSAGFAGFAYLN